MLKKVVLGLAFLGSPALASMEVASGELGVTYRSLDNSYSHTRIPLGAVVRGQLSERTYWTGGASIGLNLFSSSGPNNSMDFSALGGLRYYFSRLTDSISLFGEGYGRFAHRDMVSGQGTETGLFYGAKAGVRVSMSERFFLDVSAPLLESPLWVTRSGRGPNETVVALHAATQNWFRPELSVGYRL